MRDEIRGRELTAEEIAEHEELGLLNKAEILAALDYKLELVKAGPGESGWSAAYYLEYIRVLEEMKQQVYYLALPAHLDYEWTYEIVLNQMGAQLNLHYMGTVHLGDGYYTNTCMNILTVPTALLSVENYAKFMGVSVLTVRQWLRRGKLNIAKKYGTVWRIPKLAKPVRKYFEMRQYRVRDVVEPFSGILEELNSFDIIWIDRKSTDTFAVCYYKTVALNPQASVLEQRFDILDSKTLELDTKAKEKLEVALMESPQVYAVDLEVETLGKVEGILKYIPQEEQVLAQMRQNGSASLATQ